MIYSISPHNILETAELDPEGSRRVQNNPEGQDVVVCGVHTPLHIICSFQQCNCVLITIYLKYWIIVPPV